MLLRPLKNEVSLLDRIACGSEDAFAELFNAYHQQLGNFVFSITGNTELSEEIVQDIFLNIWVNRGSLGHIKNFSAYLYTLSKNRTLNELRQLAGRKKKDDAYNKYLLENNDGLSEEKAEYELLLDQALGNLPPQQQKVLLLKLQGHKNPEVAAQMAISLNSVKKYRQWAIQNIQKLVKSKSLFFLILFIRF